MYYIPLSIKLISKKDKTVLYLNNSFIGIKKEHFKEGLKLAKFTIEEAEEFKKTNPKILKNYEVQILSTKIIEKELYGYDR